MHELHVACFSKYHVHKYNFKARESVQIQIRVREYTISANCEQFKQERLTGVRFLTLSHPLPTPLCESVLACGV